MLRLHAIPASLYCAKTRIALRAKGLEWDEVPPPGGYGSAEYRAMVPAGNLPALEHDGLLVGDSEAIAEYLDEVFPHPALLPADPAARARVRWCGRFHDTRLEPALRGMFPLVAEGGRSRDKLAAQAELVVRRLAEAAELPRSAPLTTGSRFSLADCGYPVTFTVISVLEPVLGVAMPMPAALAAYRDALSDHPAVAAELVGYRPAITAWAEAAAGRAVGRTA